MSARLLNLTSLTGTLKRNPLAVSAVDAGFRTPLHWLMLNPKLTVTLLRLYLDFSPAAQSCLEVCDAHGVHTPIDYFMGAHKRIGHTKWRKCLLYLASHNVVGVPMYHVHSLRYDQRLRRFVDSSADEGWRKAVSVRCDALPERQHLQGNPQALHNSAREDVTRNHPDKVAGHELRKKGTPQVRR